jgi:predicted amidohydrolase
VHLRIAQIKAYPLKGDLRANHERLLAILHQVEEHRPDVVVTPECFLDGYVVTEDWISGDNLANYAVDPARSRYVATLSQWAAAHKAWLIFGCTRLVTGSACSNSALVLNRQGCLVGIYDKVHCQTHDRKFLPGKHLSVYESDFGRFGVMICADRRWPETVRTLALQGARIVFNPTYGMHGEKNLHLMQTRSYESELFIAFTHPAQSLITDPTGQIVQNAVSPGVDSALTDIDLGQVDRVRAGPSAHLRDRRPDVYVL